MAENQERRLIAVAVHNDLFVQMIRTGYKAPGYIYCSDGLPTSARLIGSYTDSVKMIGYLIFEDESFAPVPIGIEIPTRIIEMGIYYPEPINDEVSR